MNSRRKGKTGELALVRKLKEYGYDVRRSQQYAGINSDADIEKLTEDYKRTGKLL